MSKFPCSLTRNMTSHSMENLTFHSLLRWKVIILQILTTSLIQLLFERLGEYTFWAQERIFCFAEAPWQKDTWTNITIDTHKLRSAVERDSFLLNIKNPHFDSLNSWLSMNTWKILTQPVATQLSMNTWKILTQPVATQCNASSKEN